jgi:Sulfotransferase family
VQQPYPDTTSSYPPGVIVAGMGRSGTSLVTNVLGTCGWRLGDKLIKGNKRNPKGFFEDSPMNALHKRMLAEHGLSWNDVDGLRKRRGQRLTIPASERAAAEELVTGYRANGPWAWKNPRATLFLHAWAELVPEAHFLICVRHPSGVVTSLKRRGDSMTVDNPSAARYVARALGLWRTYNLAAEDFARTHPDRVSVILIPEDVPLLNRAAKGVFGKKLMHKPTKKIYWASRLALPHMALYRRMRALHDPAKLERLLQGPSGIGGWTAPAAAAADIKDVPTGG